MKRIKDYKKFKKRIWGSFKLYILINHLPELHFNFIFRDYLQRLIYQRFRTKNTRIQYECFGYTMITTLVVYFFPSKYRQDYCAP